MDKKKILRWIAVPIVAVVAWSLANWIEFGLLQSLLDWLRTLHNDNWFCQALVRLANSKFPVFYEGTEKVGTFQHFLSRGKNQELAKSKTVDLASFHFVQSISSRYRNLGRIRAQWQYSRYNKESPFSSNAVSA
nr:MAG TPA: hypothetical protein [Caudoviricetes sp.]